MSNENEDDSNDVESLNSTELWSITNNRDIDVRVRARAYQVFWYRKLSEADVLGESDISGILRYKDVFPDEVGGVIETACSTARLPTSLAKNIVDVLPPGSHAKRAVQSYIIASDSNQSVLLRFQQVLSFSADGEFGGVAAPYCISLANIMPPGDLAQAAESTIHSGLRYPTKKRLCKKIRDRASKAGTPLPEIRLNTNIAKDHLDRVWKCIRGMPNPERRRAYRDTDEDEITRQRAFDEYWSFISEREPFRLVTDDEVIEILSFQPVWPQAVARTLKMLCRWEMLTFGQANNVLSMLPATSPGYSNVFFYRTARCEVTSALDRVSIMLLFLSADFRLAVDSITHVIQTANVDELSAIRKIIEGSNVPELPELHLHTALLRRASELSGEPGISPE